MWEANQLMRDCACIQTAISSTQDNKKQLSSTVELSIYLWEYPLYLHHVICDDRSKKDQVQRQYSQISANDLFFVFFPSASLTRHGTCQPFDLTVVHRNMSHTFSLSVTIT